MPQVGELFDVKQGLLTGMNDAFILTEQQLSELPEKERRVFRPAVFRDAISGGSIKTKYHVFFPYDANGIIFKTDDEAITTLPYFFERYLIPRRSELSKRFR